MKKLYEAVRYGEEDEGVAALEEITQMGRSATPQTDQLMTNMALMIERDRIEAEFVKPTDQGGYADIYPKELGGQCADPDAWVFFDVKINQALQSGKPNKLATYRETAELVRQKLGLKKSDATQQRMTEKREKKRDIDVVKAVAAKSAATSKEESEKSDEDFHRDALNEARKHRGLL